MIRGRYGGGIGGIRHNNRLDLADILAAAERSGDGPPAGVELARPPVVQRYRSGGHRLLIAALINGNCVAAATVYNIRRRRTLAEVACDDVVVAAGA